MTLSEEARGRLADVVALQPTKNAELQERWGLDSGSEVHRFLEAELGDYYYRDENSLIRATAEAAELVDVAPGLEGDVDDLTVRVSPLEADVIDTMPGVDEDPQSVVAVLHGLRASGRDPDVEAVRSALRRLVERGVATIEQRTVTTFRLGLDRENLEVAVRAADGTRAASTGQDEADTGTDDDVLEVLESEFDGVADGP